MTVDALAASRARLCSRTRPSTTGSPMPSSHHTGPLRALPVPRAHRREATPSSMATAVWLQTRLRGVGSRLWTRRDGAQGPWSSGGSGAGCRRDARAHGPDPRRGRAAPDHRARPRVSCSPIPCVMPPLRTSAPATTPTGTRRVSPRWHPHRTWSRMGSWAAWGSPDHGWRAPAWDCSPTRSPRPPMQRDD
jgi:hypothetical protein